MKGVKNTTPVPIRCTVTVSLSTFYEKREMTYDALNKTAGKKTLFQAISGNNKPVHATDVTFSVMTRIHTVVTFLSSA